MRKSDPLRKLVIDLLLGGGAHLRAEQVFARFPTSARGKKAPGAPHTPWEILEHLRIAQWDLLQFSITPGFQSPSWPDGYWPATSAPPSTHAWSHSVQQFLEDRDALIKLANDGKRDLRAPLAHAKDTNLLYELFLAASHNSYHLGQIMLLRRMLELKRRAKR